MGSEMVGQLLGEFKIVRELGRGGMGIVYEAVQTSLNRRVALKVLGQGIGLTSRAVDRFRREAEAAAKLHHTNIVPVYATGEADGSHFYAMELIDGPSLDHVIRQMGESQGDRDGTKPPSKDAITGPYTPCKPPPPSGGNGGSGMSSVVDRFDRIATMIADVADALNHAHAQGVSHRDIKPSNLMLSSDGRLSVTDFGLARMLEQPGMTVTGEFVGTPAYMSPEQVSAGRVPVDHRTDIYSLGATLYELLTLRPPFVATGRDRLLAMVIQKEPAAPRSENGKIPKDLETICLKCLEKDPDRRYLTAKDLADDLRRFKNRFAISARRAGVVGRTQKWVKRNPAVAALIAIALVATAGAGMFAYQNHRLEARRVAEETTRREREKTEQLREVIRNAMADALAGNLPAVEMAIDTAISLNADAADIRTLRGYVAFVNGDFVASIGHFEEAVRLRPTSMLAHALLAQAYIEEIEWNKASEIRDRIETLAVEQPEDLLFKGFLYGNWDPRVGLKLMDEAMTIRSMNVGHMLRSNIRGWWANETSDTAEMELALDETAAARQLFPHSPNVAVSTLVTEMDAAVVFGEHGLDEQKKQVLSQARKHARELAGFQEAPVGLGWRCTFERYLAFESGSSVAIPSELSAVRQKSSHVYLVSFDALMHFRAGRDREALQILDTVKGDSQVDALRVIVMLGLADQQNRTKDVLERWSHDRKNPRIAKGLFMIRLALGQEDLATAEMRGKFEAGLQLSTTVSQLRDAFRTYYCSREPEREQRLLHGVRGVRSGETSAYLLIGMRQMGSGQREQAMKSFQRAAELRAIYSESWEFSLAFLERMKADPHWPAWAERGQ
jgi:tetratricopeptide (TPR) repeat protein